MMPSTLDQVRTACAAVAERAAHVHIDEGRIRPYAASLPLELAEPPALDPRHHFFGAPDDTLAYTVTLDAINFGSGYFPHLRKRPGLSGYFTVATSLKERFERDGPFSARDLRRLSMAECAEIFGQDPGAADFDGSPRAELMGLFATALNDLGGDVLERFDGRFTTLVGAADRSAERLVRILARMPFFRDVSRYGDLVVPFYKRAQLTAADLDLALGGHGLGSFDDLDRLTIFADNLVPHVLRVDGILLYDDALAGRIDREEPITAGSAEEIEIRACAVRVVEMLVGHLSPSWPLRRPLTRSERMAMTAACDPLVDRLHQIGRPATARRLDYLLWNRGQQPRYKAIPRHRARSVFY